MRPFYVFLLLLTFGVHSVSATESIQQEKLTEVGDNLIVTESLNGSLRIEWIEPANYTDIRKSNGFPHSKKYRHYVLNEIHAEFEELLLTLPNGYRLSVSIEDVDLAGDTRVGTGIANAYLSRGISFHDVRVLRSIDIPRIDFSYIIVDSDGKTIGEEKVVLKDVNYLNRTSRIGSSRPLYYEKYMLARWFKRQFKDLRVDV